MTKKIKIILFKYLLFINLDYLYLNNETYSSSIITCIS